jgi:hypothetical protein
MGMARALKKNREIDCGMELPAGMRGLRRVRRLSGIKNLFTTNTKIE